jgi:hypothetical protein
MKCKLLVDYVQVLSIHFPGVTEENHENLSHDNDVVSTGFIMT